MPLRQKAVTLLLLWLTIGYSALFVVTPLWAKLLLLGIAMAVTTHIARTKTLRIE